MSGSIVSRMLAVLAVGLCLWPASGFAESPAELEKGIRDNLARGHTLEACQLAIKMQPFKGRPEYDSAKALLMQHGISLGSPLESLSIQRMIALQNLLEVKRRQDKALPRTGPYPDHPDAWGVPVRVELVTRRAFAYLLRSAGADRKFFTEDDLALGTRDESISNTKLRNLRLGLAAGEGQEELPAGPLVDGPSSAKTAPAGGNQGAPAASQFDPARAAGRRGLYGVSTQPTTSQPAPAFPPLDAGGAGARNQPKNAGSGKTAPEREITVDELLQR